MVVIDTIFLIISIISLGFSNPNQNLWITAIFAFLTAFFSATQDIIIDAYRIEILEDEKQGAGAAATQFGYRLGGIIAGAGSLYLKHLFEWSIVFFIVATFIAFLMIIIVVVKVDFDRIHRSSENFLTPFKEFISRNTIEKNLVIIFLIFFFKFGDVVAGIMANPFYVKIGFTNIEIANASKIFGVIMTLVGVFLGGYLVKKIGLINSLIISAFFSNFVKFALCNVE